MKKTVSLAVGSLFLIGVPFFVKNPYHIHLLIILGIYSILTMSFVMQLRVGLISMGIAAFWGMGAYASALLASRLGFSFWFSLPLAGIITAVMAFGIGFVIVRPAGISFLIMTLALNFILVQILGTTYVELFGGWGGITGIPRPFLSIPFLGFLEFVSKVSYYYLMLFLLLLTTLAFHSIYHSRIGRAFDAIGETHILSASMGINVFKYRLWAFVIASFFTGLAGSFYAHYQCFLVPEAFDFWKSIYLQIYSILGGISYPILGPIVGSATAVVVPELLRVTGLLEPIFYGILILVVALFLPGGIVGFFQSSRHIEILTQTAKRTWALVVPSLRGRSNRSGDY